VVIVASSDLTLDAECAAGWEGLFWLVFARSANPIALLDDQRRIVELNDSALSLFGGERGAVIGTSMAERVRPGERSAAAREWAAFLRSGEYAGTRVLLRADGSEVQIEFAARLHVVSGSSLAIYVAIAHQNQQLQLSAPRAELPLTSREREVITLIALGNETPQIAEKLHVSQETVRTHVRNAMSKLGAGTRAQLVAIVLCNEQTVHRRCLED
jgi:PAS domain S-box-containing protein